jgi:hypothetical protein
MRYTYHIDRPQLLAPGELSVKQVAARLGIAPKCSSWTARSLNRIAAMILRIEAQTVHWCRYTARRCDIDVDISAIEDAVRN